MINIEDTEVMGMRKAINGMRNAMNSWDKSDSYTCMMEFDNPCSIDTCEHNKIGKCKRSKYDSQVFIIGEKDMDLAKRLIKASSPDRKFMRMIHVQADVTAPFYWWKEYDTYKVGTTANSCSTMHTIHKRDFTIDDFSHDRLDNDIVYNYLKPIIEGLNLFRTQYNNSKDKKYWNQMIQLLPSSFNQMRTIDLSYETLFSIYHQRKNHKLDEWRTFCEWIENLPYMRDFLS